MQQMFLNPFAALRHIETYKHHLYVNLLSTEIILTQLKVAVA